MNSIINDVTKRHDFVLLFDVADGNPNGDPDAGNLPRVDPETMQGLVTDVCLKRKVRNYVDAMSGDQETMKIYVQNKGVALNDMHKRAYDAEGMKSTGTKQKREDVDAARKWMCKNFYDIRMFGAVMTTEVNCGQVRGPLQITFARSIDQIIPMDVSITRVAVTKPEDTKAVEGEGETGGKTTEMGRKALLPYGLYKSYGFFTPGFAKDTGVTSEDLKIFWAALQNMWDIDRSASRGMMASRGVYIFSHECPYGNAPANKLLELVDVPQLNNSPRSFSEYKDKMQAPDSGSLEALGFPGVTLTRLV
ncbi:MAG: type I-C CRISPR-associated protein Cas7/Csd2 [Geobacteraceae bacterium]|nr:type I-C CRISPR-associated protein Cas7/Csd2 [Geobacteraceae bacterium]